MIALTFLRDEYIDRPKLTELKKSFEYIIPPPQVGSEQWKHTLQTLMIKRYHVARTKEKNIITMNYRNINQW